MTSVKKLLKVYKKKLSNIGVKNARTEILWMIEEVTNRPLINNSNQVDIKLNKEDFFNIELLLKMRLSRIPLSRILKKISFRNIELSLSDKSFAPRIDSEFLIDKILEKKVLVKSFLELGTGSGAITISLLDERSDVRAIATDISYEAIYIAKKNAILNNVQSRVQFICCNWLNSFVNLNFDLIIANPPYIRTQDIKCLEPEVKKHDPLIAIDGGTDGLDSYKRICKSINNITKKRLAVLFEIGYDQADDVCSIMRRNNFLELEVFKDYENNDRCIFGIIN